MRALPLIVLAMTALGAPVAAQDTVDDTDFGFTMNLPPGMRELPSADRAMALGLTPEDAANPARESMPDGKVAHYYMWLDATSPYNRQIGIILRDGPPPFIRPDEMYEATARSGLKIDQQASGPMPSPVDGMRIEGTFERTVDGVEMRKVMLYLPDFDGERYATVNIQAFNADWPIVQAEVETMLQSVRFRRAPVSPGSRGGPRATKAATGKPADTDPGTWGSLPVAGTLVLAFAMLAHLFVGGRATR